MTVRKLETGDIAHRLWSIRRDGKVTPTEQKQLEKLATGKVWRPDGNPKTQAEMAWGARHAGAMKRLADVDLQVSGKMPGVSIGLSPTVETLGYDPSFEPAGRDGYEKPNDAYGRRLTIEQPSRGTLRASENTFRDDGKVTLTVAGKKASVTWRAGEPKEDVIRRLQAALGKSGVRYHWDSVNFYVLPPAT